MFIKNAPNSHGFVNPRDIEDIWRDHFDYFYREYDEFIFPITIHPDVSAFLYTANSRKLYDENNTRSNSIYRRYPADRMRY